MRQRVVPALAAVVVVLLTVLAADRVVLHATGPDSTPCGMGRPTAPTPEQAVAKFYVYCDPPPRLTPGRHEGPSEFHNDAVVYAAAFGHGKGRFVMVWQRHQGGPWQVVQEGTGP